MGVNSAAVILAENGDFSNFSSPDKILAYAGYSPSTYQSGKLTNCYAHMEKRGSRYLRYALYNATKYVCHWNPVFAEYLAKKHAEGKHYNVALSYAKSISCSCLILSVVLAALISAFECCLSGAAVGRRIFSFWVLTFNS